MSDETAKLYDDSHTASVQKSSPSAASSPAEQKARKEAEAYFKQADSHLKPSSGFFGLFSSGPNYYDAIECFQRAGNILKEVKLCTERWMV